jgi:hypothetical protein
LTSRYVYKIKRSAAIARIIASIAAANDLELHSIDIEQAFLHADKLMEGVNGRYFINAPPGSPDANNKDTVYEVLHPLHGNTSSSRALHKTMDAFFKSEGFDTIGFEESFKEEILTRFIGTDEGEVTEYLGCELISNRSAKTAKLVQRAYAERVLRMFGMWDCKPCATPLDANSRLSKKDFPQVVDPALHRRYRSITGCLSYLVNMTSVRYL